MQVTITNLGADGFPIAEIVVFSEDLIGLKRIVNRAHLFLRHNLL